MKFSIVPFENKYMEDMAGLFMKEYSEPGYEWDLATSKAYMQRDIDSAPDYCFAALDDNGKCIGGVLCRIDPYYKGSFLFIDSLQVSEHCRNQGVGKALMKASVDKARENGIGGVHFLADGRVDFPKGWYERMGFKPTNWVEYEIHIDDLDL